MPWLGLAAGPALWAVNTQLGLTLPYADCAGFRWSLAVSLIAAALALLAASFNWLDRRSAGVGVFVSRLAASAAAVFVFALLLQAGAGFVVTGCER